jgi:hypothetical protein
MRTKISREAAKKAEETARIKSIIATSPVSGEEFKSAIEKSDIIILKWAYLDAIDAELHLGKNISRIEAIGKGITGKLTTRRADIKVLHKRVVDYMEQARKISEMNPEEIIIFSEDNNWLGICVGLSELPESTMQIAAFKNGKKIREAYGHV